MKYIILNCPAVNAETGECCGNGGYYKDCENNEKCLLKRLALIPQVRDMLEIEECENE